MKIFNVIITWDIPCFAETESAAIEAILDLIKSGELSATHSKALELKASPLKPQWRDERPIVANDVSDEDFAKLQGKTTQEGYDLLKLHPRSMK